MSIRAGAGLARCRRRARPQRKQVVMLRAKLLPVDAKAGDVDEGIVLAPSLVTTEGRMQDKALNVAR